MGIGGLSKNEIREDFWGYFCFLKMRKLVLAKKVIGLLLACMTSMSVYAQKFHVQGRIADAKWGRPIAGALVLCEKYKVFEFADESGNFNLLLPFDSIKLTVSAAGFVTTTEAIWLPKNLTFDINLKPSLLNKTQLPIATFVSVGFGKKYPHSIGYTIKEVEKLPVLFQPDYLKYMQTEPGVQKGVDGGSMPLVRGGNNDQNLYLMDGVPLYNPYHSIVYFSVFNKNVVQKMTLHKGGFQSKYGGRLSSVLEVTTQQGNIKQISGSGSLALGTADINIDGPLGKKVTFMLAARRSYIDLLLKPFMNDTGNGGTIRYVLSDLNANVAVNADAKNRIVISAYSGKDAFYVGEGEYQPGPSATLKLKSRRDDIGWKNRVVQVNWEHKMSPQTTANFRAYYTGYDFVQSRTVSVGLATTKQKDSVDKLSLFSGIKDFAALADFESTKNSKEKIYFGVSVVAHAINPGRRNNKITALGQVKMDISRGFVDDFICPEIAVYTDWHKKINDHQKLVIGVRPTLFISEGKQFFYADPHLLFEYITPKKISTTFTVDVMHQPLQLISLNDQGMPYEAWVPAKQTFKPQQCIQVAASAAKDVWKKYTASGSVFYKDFRNLAMLAPGAYTAQVFTDWSDRLAKGIGRAYGLEFQLRKNEGITTGYLSYTLLWSERKYTDANLQQGFGLWEDVSGWFPTRFGRRHDLSIVMQNKITRKGMLCFIYTISSGEYTNVPNAAYRMPMSSTILNNWTGQTVYSQSSRNNYRLPLYHRMDMSWVVDRKSQIWKGTTMGISLYNMFSSFNATGVNVSTNRNGQKNINYSRLWPIIPSIYYTFRF